MRIQDSFSHFYRLKAFMLRFVKAIDCESFNTDLLTIDALLLWRPTLIGWRAFDADHWGEFCRGFDERFQGDDGEDAENDVWVDSPIYWKDEAWSDGCEWTAVQLSARDAGRRPHPVRHMLDVSLWHARSCGLPFA